MKYKKQWAMALFVCLQMLFPVHVKAAVNDHLFLNVKETAFGIKEYSLEYDLNEDGKTDVFDVIRVKQIWPFISEKINEIEADITSLKELYSACNIKDDKNDIENDKIKQELLSVSEKIKELEREITFFKELSLEGDVNGDGKTDVYDADKIKETCLFFSEKIIKLETDITSLQECVDNIEKKVDFKQIENYYKIVDKSGNGDYISLTAAVDSAQNGDIIYVRSGEYDNEVVKGWGKDITIIGEDPLNTIIKNGTNNYDTPPMEMSCGKIKNLTVYAYDGGYPSTHPLGWTAYSIHIDNNGLYKNTLDIENCILKSDKNYGVGIGLRKGTLRFSNCKFYSRDEASFFFHDAVNSNVAGDQYLILKDCYGVSHSSAVVMRIDSQKTEGANVYPEIINCTFVSDITDEPIISHANMDNTGGTSTNVGTFMGLINFYQIKTSRNNYPEILNYQYN